jgi:hypothetical protein
LLVSVSLSTPLVYLAHCPVTSGQPRVISAILYSFGQCVVPRLRSRVNMNPCRKGGIQLARPDVSVYFFPFLFAETKTLLLCYWRIFPACCFPPLPSRSYLFSTSWRRGPPGAMPVTLAPASISGRLIQETEGNCRGAGLSFIWETLLLFASVYFLNLDASSL